MEKIALVADVLSLIVLHLEFIWKVNLFGFDASVTKAYQEEREKFLITDGRILINSLPIGCASKSLPLERFRTILGLAGLPLDVADNLFAEYVKSILTQGEAF